MKQYLTFNYSFCFRTLNLMSLMTYQKKRSWNKTYEDRATKVFQEVSAAVSRHQNHGVCQHVFMLQDKEHSEYIQVFIINIVYVFFRLVERNCALNSDAGGIDAICACNYDICGIENKDYKKAVGA